MLNVRKAGSFWWLPIDHFALVEVNLFDNCFFQRFHQISDSPKYPKSAYKIDVIRSSNSCLSVTTGSIPFNFIWIESWTLLKKEVDWKMKSFHRSITMTIVWKLQKNCKQFWIVPRLKHTSTRFSVLFNPSIKVYVKKSNLLLEYPIENFFLPFRVSDFRCSDHCRKW